jgi:hypothetical protein
VKKRVFGLLLFLFFSALLPLACKSGGEGPSSPSGQGGGPVPTSTATSTATSTPTITPTPNCLGFIDITSNIDGADINGNDSTDYPRMDLEDYGPNGDVYTFTLTSAKNLNFSLCPTDDPERDTVLFLRSGHCWETAGELFNDDYCDLLSEISTSTMGGPLAPGTYYLIVSENFSSVPNPYILRVTSGPLPGAICTATPVSTPQAANAGATCVTSYDLGGGQPLGAGDSVATGHIDDTVSVENYYSFTPADSGTVTVIVDCYENGLGNSDLGVDIYSGCPIDSGNLVDSASAQVSVQTLSFPVTGGTAYFADVYSLFGGGNYRLTVQTP